MEAHLRTLLETTFGEYVTGLSNMDLSLPLVLRDLQLKEAKIQEELDEEGNFPFDITGGRIGSISVDSSLFGAVEVKATNIVLTFQFSPTKAWKLATKGAEEEGHDEYQEQRAPTPRALAQPAAPVPPRYCVNHSTSEQRPKGEAVFRECRNCNTRVGTNYLDFTLCPPCSDRQRRCMLCGAPATSDAQPPGAGAYQPCQEPSQGGLPFTPPPPRSKGYGKGKGKGYEDEPPPPPPPPRRGFGGPGYGDRKGGKGDYGKGDYRRGDYGKGEYGKGDSANRSFGKGDYGKDRGDYGKGRDVPFGRDEFKGKGKGKGEELFEGGGRNFETDYGRSSQATDLGRGIEPIANGSPGNRFADRDAAPPQASFRGAPPVQRPPPVEEDDGLFGLTKLFDFDWTGCVHPQSDPTSRQQATSGNQRPVMPQRGQFPSATQDAWRGGG